MRLNLKLAVLLALVLAASACNEEQLDAPEVYYPANVLDYAGTPGSAKDRTALAFSDQGAWFAYAFPTEARSQGGFAGPFLMTQENGIWSSKVLSQLELVDAATGRKVDWGECRIARESYPSHMEQTYEKDGLKATQTLFFASAHTALISTRIENTGSKKVEFEPLWRGSLFAGHLACQLEEPRILLRSTKSPARGSIRAFGLPTTDFHSTDSTYSIGLESFALEPGASKTLHIAQQFIFPEYDLEAEERQLEKVVQNASQFLEERIAEKTAELEGLYGKMGAEWADSNYKDLFVKTLLTLQNNWRVPAGELHHSGLFPSYHYIWFHGFWAWDSWKHAAALAHFNHELAQEQVRAMYAFQNESGFIADCVYRDTTIEAHNYRNTKPPLSAWAVWQVYEQSRDIDFLRELYPQIVLHHNWWYAERDHDGDGLCEYGSTDGTLIAAKWESGMDNAVRFDSSQILENAVGAYSLDQESVDLNAYLYAEKGFLKQMAEVLKEGEMEKWEKEGEELKRKIQEQFFDAETGWFYDTSLDGARFVKAKGCEGWIPLWAKAATPEQAEAVRKTMMNPANFFTKVPFQTLSADHPKYKPDGGYWRGPNWLDQSYFGVRALHNYGFHEAAQAASRRLIHNAEGVLPKGKSIRENYHPDSGAGLESESFSWSAAHFLLLLIDE